VLSIHLIATSFAFTNLANAVAWGSAQAFRPAPAEKIIHNYRDVMIELQNGNGMGGNWDKNMFPHISTVHML